MEWMTIRGLSKATNFPEHAIRMLVKDETIPSIMVGNRNMIHYETAIGILTSQQAPKEEKSDGDTRKMDAKDSIEILQEIDKQISESMKKRHFHHRDSALIIGYVDSHEIVKEYIEKLKNEAGV